jgi:hypothetical protein
MVTANHEARTVGVVYVVRDRKLYVATDREAWKARHIAAVAGNHGHGTITAPEEIVPNSHRCW